MLNNIKEQLENGEIGFCEAYAMLKNIESELKVYISEVKSSAIEEAKEFNKDEPYYGYMWTVRNGYPVYDFDSDPEYKQLKDKVSSRQKLLKEASKAKSENKVFFSQETGEEIPSVSIKSYTEDSLIFKPVKG